jgi:hypothetical protein
VLTELDPVLFCDQEFYNDIVKSKQEISEMVEGQYFCKALSHIEKSQLELLKQASADI